MNVHQPRRQTITTSDGTSLAVEEYGGGTQARVTIVLVHGLCLSQATWSPQIRLLLRRYGTSARIISFDWRGHGQSGSADMDTYTVEQLGRDLAEVLRVLGVSRQLLLVGHSMGAMAALSYFAIPVTQRPIEPAGLVLVATAAGRVPERGLGRLLALPVVELFAEAVIHVPRHGAERALWAIARSACRTASRLCGYRETERATLASAIDDALRYTSIRTAVGFLLSIKKLDLYNVLPSISAATTVLSGSDVLTPVVHSNELAAGIPHAVHRHIPEAGHMLLHEAPHAVVSEISRTIDIISGSFDACAGASVDAHLTSGNVSSAVEVAPRWSTTPAPPVSQIIAPLKESAQ
ncbi:alpha/beta fold hydrolase [Mycolicibacterium fortuitum]|uniref:alpha/beta fold hydrolase n=1 Tax=Mycolicibacterium fortuitum TaxID=1766 RepID=UPI001CE0CAE7|nr:alpha/beta hydrolase [Mycolicibacterium fortuitum]MCA4726655.1 alpha/beta hydrolase [Mycolicibacterium fortuitum]